MSDTLGLTPQGQTITFNEIPATQRDPAVLTELRPTYGDVGLLLLPSKILVISQMLAGGSATPGVIYPITGPGQAEILFGAGSVAATQINAVLANNTSTPLFAVGLKDVAGAVAASSTMVTSACTFAGGWAGTLRVGGLRVPVVVPGGSSNIDLCNAVIAALEATSASLVTAAAGATAGTLIFTAKNAGVVGNSINLRWTGRSDASVPLVSIAFYSPNTTTPTEGGPSVTLEGGLGSPDMSSVLSAVSGTWYTDFITPWTDPNNRAEIAAEGIRRYLATVNLDARFWSGLGGSYASCAGYGDAGNSIQMVTVGLRNGYEPDWVWGAVWGAIHAFRLANDPSRQSKGIACVGLTAPDPQDQWTPEERGLLLQNGISTWTALNDGTVVISRTITGYLESTLGVPDAAWLDVMTPATLSAIRYDWDNYVKLVYPNAKLFDDGSAGANYDDTACTPKRMKGSWGKRCLDYERAGWIEGSAQTVPQSSFVRNPSDKNRLDGEMVVTICGNLMVSANVLEFTA